MKISKVNGIRSATLGFNHNGILYYKDKPNKTTTDIVKSRIQAANSLYNVFRLQFKRNNGKKTDADAIYSKLSVINSVCNKVIKNEIREENFLTEIINIDKTSVENPPEIAIITQVVEKKLRRGLKSQQDFLVELVALMMSNNKGTRIKFFTAYNDLNGFINALRFDYNKKTNSAEKLISSIENQKTNIIIKDNEFKFGCTENENKKVIEKFLIDYAKDANVLTSVFQMIEQQYFEVDINKDKEKPFIQCAEKSDIPHAFSEKFKSLYEAKIKNETDENKLFWFKLVHQYLVNEFVKKLAKDKKQKRLKAVSNYTYGYVIHRCHGMIKNYITSKYLQLGKAVYHFYDFENGKPYLDNLTSFDYELIKAKDTLCQKVNTSIVFACNSFLSSMPNLTEKEIGNKEISNLKDIDRKLLLRFFGGKSFIPFYDEINVNTLATEINRALYSLRNDHFHYCDEKKEEKINNYDTIKKLFDLEMDKQGEYLIEKYKSNNVYMFYSELFIDNLIKKLYAKQITNKLYIPSFKSVLPVSKYDFNIFGAVYCSANIFKATSYFLLKEIYYHAFICDADAGRYFTDALVNRMKNPINEDNKQAWLEFKAKINTCENNFERICELCIREYADFNSKPEHTNSQPEKHQGDYLKMFLHEITRSAFLCYVKEKFEDLHNHNYNEDYNEVNPTIPQIKIEINLTNDLLEWYTLAKFIDPKELNMLRGDFAKYDQFIDDINKRKNNLVFKFNDPFYNSVTKHFNNSNDIIKLIDVCQVASGRISNNVADYYEDCEDYAKELGNYLEYEIDKNKTVSQVYKKLENFCFAQTGKKEIYINDKNPIIFSIIEKMRMYGADSLLHKVIENFKITKLVFDNYIKLNESENIYYLNTSSKLDNKTDIINRNQYIKLENRVKLHDVARLYSLLYDLYSQLISWCYKWERDYGYYLMGFMYLKDKSELNTIRNIFMYGKDITDELEENEKENPRSISDKLKDYLAHNKGKLKPQLNTLFAMNNSENVFPLSIRNGIDHMELFKGTSRHSLFEYYNYMTTMFAYDRKTQNDIMVRFKKIFERDFIECELKFVKKSNFDKISIQKLTSKQFVYKVKKEDKIEAIKVDANSDIFKKEVETLVFYNPKQ